jgi:hypothetical protein
MANLKLDYIPLFEGATNYAAWARATIRTLQAEDLWTHVKGVEDDPLSPWTASYALEISGTSTVAQKKAFWEGWQDDAKVKDIVEHRCSPLVLNNLSQDMNATSQETWGVLKGFYAKVDIHAQFALRQHVASLCLADPSDVTQYLGEFNVTQRHFVEMGVEYSEQEAIYQLFEELPGTASWDNFKQILLELVETITDRVSRNASNGQDLDAEDTQPLCLTLAPNSLYTTIAQRISSECACLASVPHSQGPGSEYAQVAHEIQRHPENLKGVLRTNPLCTRRRESHDWEHCWAKGGGSEGQGPRGAKPAVVSTLPNRACLATETVSSYPLIDFEELEC